MEWGKKALTRRESPSWAGFGVTPLRNTFFQVFLHRRSLNPAPIWAFQTHAILRTHSSKASAERFEEIVAAPGIFFAICLFRFLSARLLLLGIGIAALDWIYEAFTQALGESKDF